MVAYPVVMTLILQVHSAKRARKSTLISLKPELLGQVRSRHTAETGGDAGANESKYVFIAAQIIHSFDCFSRLCGPSRRGEKGKST
jgi:hypothetical protein